MKFNKILGTVAKATLGSPLSTPMPTIVLDVMAQELYSPLSLSFDDFRLENYKTIKERFEAEAKLDTYTANYQLNYNEGLGLAAAVLANHVYPSLAGIRLSRLPEGWKVSKDFKDLQKHFVQKNGLVSQLYERTRFGNKEYIYATAGTHIVTMIQDLYNNYQQLYGDAGQYESSAEIAQELSYKITMQGDTLVFTGHSLGGGLATLNALLTYRDAFVFNPAALSKATLSRHGFDYHERIGASKVTNFIATTDILNIVQDYKNDDEESPLIASIGQRTYIDVASDTHGHSMDKMEAALKKLSKL